MSFSRQNSKGLIPEPGGLFQEHTDYLVNRQELLGGGTYGKVHPAYLQLDKKRVVVVVKEVRSLWLVSLHKELW